jgi:hypothetical protein
MDIGIVYQTDFKYCKWPSKNTNIFSIPFWSENMPSGNPVADCWFNIGFSLKRKKIVSIDVQSRSRHMFVHTFNSGLPDGLFSNQKYQFGNTLEGLGMGNVVIF